MPAEITVRIFETVFWSARSDILREGKLAEVARRMVCKNQSQARALHRRIQVREEVRELLRIASVCKSWREAAMGKFTPLIRPWRVALADLRGRALGSPALESDMHNWGATATVNSVMRYMACVARCEWVPSDDHVDRRITRAAEAGRLCDRMFARFGIDFSARMQLASVNEAERRVSLDVMRRGKEERRVYAKRVRMCQEIVSAARDPDCVMVVDLPPPPSAEVSESELHQLEALRKEREALKARLRRTFVAPA